MTKIVKASHVVASAIVNAAETMRERAARECEITAEQLTSYYEHEYAGGGAFVVRESRHNDMLSSSIADLRKTAEAIRKLSIPSAY